MTASKDVEATSVPPVVGESRAARIVTEVLSPFHVVIPLPVILGWHQTFPSSTGLVWGLFAGFFGGVVPYAIVLWRVSRGTANNRHITRREQRLVPLVLSLASVLGGLVVLLLGDPPSSVLGAQVALLVLGLIMLPITAFWKISFHTAGVAGAVAVFTLTFGPWLVLAWPLVALVAWSRIRLSDHTVLQTVAGGLLGVTIATTVYALIS